MADELLDQVDKDDNVIGTVWKNHAHGNPDIIHREVGICLFNKKNEILLAQRSFEKKVDPGAWMMASAGHPGSGEDLEISVNRELFEELGFEVKPIFYGKNLITHKIRGKRWESRFFYLYYAVLDDYPKLNLQKEEVNDAKWVKLDDLETFAKKNKYDLNGYTHKKIVEIAKYLKLI